uniref:Uncharacterized protein n=1 Tax=Gadus morhua TaxID=8049 RepID=A0A8C5CL31_GADMO
PNALDFSLGSSLREAGRTPIWGLLLAVLLEGRRENSHLWPRIISSPGVQSLSLPYHGSIWTSERPKGLSEVRAPGVHTRQQSLLLHLQTPVTAHSEGTETEGNSGRRDFFFPKNYFLIPGKGYDGK